MLLFWVLILGFPAVEARAAEEGLKEQEVEASKIKDAISDAADSLRNSLRADRRIYQDYADDRLDLHKARVKELKGKLSGVADPEEQTRHREAVKNLEVMKDETRETFRNLKSSDENAWHPARAVFERSLDKMEERIKDAGSDLLGEKRKYEWDLESTVIDMKYAIREAKFKSRDLEGKTKARIRTRIADLEDLKDSVEDSLRKVKFAKAEEDWNHLREEAEQSADAFDGLYTEI